MERKKNETLKQLELKYQIDISFSVLKIDYH